ncbi:MAG: toll/interleukin-1 receptor domain-containing protein [Vicinamibacterales bacterium]
MKIFISYSTHDLRTAESVYSDMVRAGAEAFQFRESAIIGKPSWEQVLDWISESETFIVLISKKALESKPVREEIGHAHHSYMNSPKPEKIVSAIIEKAARPPRLIERFTTVDFLDYEDGIGRLMKQLGLERTRTRAKSPAMTTFSLPDLGPIFQDFKKKNPEPTPVEQFSKAAETILANYDALKPGQIKGPERAKHLDLILSGLPGAATSPKATRAAKDFALKDYNKWFLGYDPGDPKVATPALAASLLNWTPLAKGEPLPAPRLKWSVTGLTWNEILGATGYVLEASAAPGFTEPMEVYRGGETKYGRLSLNMLYSLQQLSHFRVKAIGGVFKPDSAWSNVVTDVFMVPIAPAFGSLLKDTTLRTTLGAPALGLKQDKSTMRLSWTKVDGATGYVLESSTTLLFAQASRVYEGPLTFYVDVQRLMSRVFKIYYRVKATGGLKANDSEWSNAVSSKETGL